MTVTFDIDAPAFAQSLKEQFQAVKEPCQFAMAEAFKSVADNNIGDDGEDRPIGWHNLSEKYAKRVGRSHATLFLDMAEAAKLRKESGLLLNSTVISQNNQDAAIVENGCEYAMQHQNTRPFFPIIDGEVTPYTTQKCVDACEKALEGALI